MKIKALALFLFFLFIPISWTQGGEAQSSYPSTFWSSERIHEPLRSIRVGAVFPDNRKDIVVLGSHRLMVYRWLADHSYKILDYKGNNSEEWIKLTLFDLDQDGTDEVFISGFLYGKVCTLMGRIKGEKWVRGESVPYFISELVWEGKKILVGQTSVGGDDFSGPLFEMVWDGKKLIPGKTIKLPGGLSGDAMPIYSVSGFGSGFLYLNGSGKIIYFAREGEKYRKKWMSGETYGGPVITINREVKNVLNETEKKRFVVPLSPQIHTPSEIYVIKNAGYLDSVIGAVASIKNTQLTRLTWTDYGFQETWNSPRLDGALTDFTFFDWDGDGKDEIVATFLLRDNGYIDTLKKQDSLIIVLKLPP